MTLALLHKALSGLVGGWEPLVWTTIGRGGIARTMRNTCVVVDADLNGSLKQALLRSTCDSQVRCVCVCGVAHAAVTRCQQREQVAPVTVRGQRTGPGHRHRRAPSVSRVSSTTPAAQEQR